eukprot:Phypoly_transcript_08953.p1 GENE.Phypoly_transcript_08953~~Phypoly_transcript_08953.p1  ORF type:complete len:450 (-),score=41.96 Phypoly_transcript_08953:30-1379(-)
MQNKFIETESTSSVANDHNLAAFLVQRALDVSREWSRSLGVHVSKGVSEMLKWTVVTAINDVIRRPISACLDYFFSYFTVSVEIGSNDDLFRQFSEWMAAQEFVKSTRELVAKSTQTKPPNISFVPGKGMHFFWYRRRPAWIWRPTFASVGNSIETIRITTFGRDTNKVKQILFDAMDYSRRNEIGKYLIYTPNFRDYTYTWKPMGDPRTPRAPETLILPAGQYEDIKNDCERFLKSKDWYAERGIPYRRGYLFYGTPGSGKSSLTEVLAGVLGLDIAMLTLSHPAMNDQYLSLLLNSAPTNSIIFIEDIDTMFDNRQKQGEPNKPKLNLLTFSGLLNALDGISAQGGRILMMTTNHIELLDKALIRDGRVDRRIQFHDATQQQARTLFARFFSLPESDPRCKQFSHAIPDGKLSMARLQGHLLIHQTPEAALANLNEVVSNTEYEILT